MEYSDAIYRIFEIITRDYEKPIFIDIGCDCGHFPKNVIPESFTNKLHENGLMIGIDPQDYPGRYPYHYYIQGAVSQNEGEQTFYYNDEKGCSSLRYMLTQNVTHVREDKNIAWFVDRNIQTFHPSTTTCFRLDTIIRNYAPEAKLIHFVECDAEGADIECILSAGNHLKNILFLQIEASTHPKNIQLYTDQQPLSVDIQTLHDKGFKVLALEDYGEKASPQANVIFYNTRFYDSNLNKIKDNEI